MIRFACPVCHKVIKVVDNGAGRKVHCPRCTQLVVVPAPFKTRNKPMMGLLLPDKGLPETSSTEPDSSFIEHSFEDIIALTEFKPDGPFDPPPVRQVPLSTNVLEEETASFVTEEQAPIRQELPETPAGDSQQASDSLDLIVAHDVAPAENVGWPKAHYGIDNPATDSISNDQSPATAERPPLLSFPNVPFPGDGEPVYEPSYPVPQKQSVTGMLTTLGAILLLIAFLAFSWFHQDSVARLKKQLDRDPHNVSIMLALGRLASLGRIAKSIGISGTIIGLLLAAVSFLWRTKRFWSIAGCAANGVLLIYQLC